MSYHQLLRIIADHELPIFDRSKPFGGKVDWSQGPCVQGPFAVDDEVRDCRVYEVKLDIPGTPVLEITARGNTEEAACLNLVDRLRRDGLTLLTVNINFVHEEGLVKGVKFSYPHKNNTVEYTYYVNGDIDRGVVYGEKKE